MSKSASHRWLTQHYEQIAIRVKPGDRARLAAAAAARGVSAAALVVESVNSHCGETVLTPLGAPIQRKAAEQPEPDTPES